MNIHPLVVHFPVALLMIYTLFEIARFPFLTRQDYYFYIKATLLLIGSFTSYIALQTGEIARDTGGYSKSAIVEMHEQFADITVWIFTLLAVAYLVAWINKQNLFMKFRSRGMVTKIWSLMTKVSRNLLQSFIVIPLAVLGLGAITITAGLGGALVYGLKFDPFMAPVFRLLGLM